MSIQDYQYRYTYFIVSELRESIDNDTKDDIQSNSCDDDKESDVKESFM